VAMAEVSCFLRERVASIRVSSLGSAPSCERVPQGYPLPSPTCGYQSVRDITEIMCVNMDVW
jgi:hypothetical protein